MEFEQGAGVVVEVGGLCFQAAHALGGGLGYGLGNRIPSLARRVGMGWRRSGFRVRPPLRGGANRFRGQRANLLAQVLRVLRTIVRILGHAPAEQFDMAVPQADPR